jgi:hypothetical protein
MPIGILIIMKKSKHGFVTAGKLSGLIDNYFKYIEGECHLIEEAAKGGKDQIKQRMWDREPEPPTIAGLALFLGFNSKKEFYEYEENGKFAPVLKRAHLRVESAYEKKLHSQSSAGAIFALKNMGCEDRQDDKMNAHLIGNVKIEIIETGGPALADSEKQVIL